MQTYFAMAAVTVIVTLLGINAIRKTGDTKWSFIFGFSSIVPIAMILAYAGEGAGWRRLLILALVVLYSGRMLYTLIFWFGATGAAKLDKELPQSQLYAIPVVLTVTFCWIYPLPIFFAMDRAGPLNLLDFAAFFVYGAGTYFHLAADHQKWKFKQDPANKGQLLDRALWGRSRHPNYFGDFLIFCSFAVISGSLWGIVSPIANLLQYFFDAIPKNESMAQKKYGETWDNYASKTPVFLPFKWPRS